MAISGAVHRVRSILKLSAADKLQLTIKIPADNNITSREMSPMRFTASDTRALLFF
jgi:hypothetical protein